MHANDDRRAAAHGPAVRDPGTTRRGADATGQGSGAWERTLIADLLRESVLEKRRARRWRIFSRVLMLLAFIGAVFYATGFLRMEPEALSQKHTAVVEITRPIDADGPVNARQVNQSLRSAFADRNTAGVILRINSPGGSPVQSGQIHDEIRRLRREHPRTPVYAVVEDVCASGAYYVAAAADRIYVDKASLIGSIGVLMDGFGFTGLMDKLGVERRLLTAGVDKGMLDPFTPLSDEHRKRAQLMLDEIHRQFIDVVRKGRGDRLKEKPELFSGQVWTGEHSLTLGIADELGSMSSVSRDVIEAPRLVDFTRRESVLERVSRQVGTAAGETAVRLLRSEAERTAVRAVGP